MHHAAMLEDREWAAAPGASNAALEQLRRAAPVQLPESYFALLAESYGGEGPLPGPGLSPDQQAKLFQRFSQVDGSSTRKHGGTGLGLAICKGLSEAMGGGISVRSVRGEGATFAFSVAAPVVDAPMDADGGLADQVFLAGARVLVVDDNPANRELARAILTVGDADVTEAGGGAEALALAAAAPFDLILLDLRMPGLDGAQTCRLLRTRPGPNRDIPVLAFSADGSDFD